MKTRIAIILSAVAALNAQNPEAKDALDAVRALNSITEAGVTYRDYSPRVLDAKIKVDRYLDSAKSDDAQRVKIRVAMKLHVLASRLWNNKIQGYASSDVAEIILNDPELSTLPAIAAKLPECRKQAEEDDRKGGHYTKGEERYRFLVGYELEHNIPLLWTSASDVLKQIEVVK